MLDARYLALATAFVLVFSGGTLADGNAAKGKKVFKKCTACHSLQAGKKKTGPSLAGVLGSKAGSVSGYKYSASLRKAGDKGLTWKEETLEGYLANPKKFVRKYLGDGKAKSKMVFKLKKDDDRDNVIAFLAKQGN